MTSKTVTGTCKYCGYTGRGMVVATTDPFNPNATNTFTCCKNPQRCVNHGYRAF